MSWSNRYPGLETRPSNLQSSPALLSPAADENVRQIAQSRLNTPFELLEERAGDSEFGGGGAGQVTVVVAASLCDIQPISTTAETPPKGFENETLFRVFLSAQLPVNLNARLRVPGWLATWEPNAAVVVGARVVPTGDFGNGHFYECLEGGQTAGLEPLWDERRGAKITDGVALWREAGEAFTLEVVLHDAERSRDSLVCVLCKLLR